MLGTPVTLDELLASKSFAGKAEIIRALDAERATHKAAVEAAQSRADHAVRALRDQFAMAALPAVLRVEVLCDPDHHSWDDDIVANQTYSLAEAMMRARERANEGAYQK